MRRLLCASVLALTGCFFNPGALPYDDNNGGVGGGGPGGDSDGGVGPGDDGDTAQARLTLDVTTLDFGDQVVGSTSGPQVVTVTNAGALASGPVQLNVDGAAAAEFQVTSDCAALDPGASCQVMVRYRPQLAIAASAIAGVSAQPGGAAQIALTGRAHSTDNVVLTPQAQDFGHAPFNGTGATKPFTIHNLGTKASGTLPAATLGGLRPRAFTITADACQGQVLQPGDQCEVDVQLTPDHSGALAATLQVGILGAALTGFGDGHGFTVEDAQTTARFSGVWADATQVYAVGGSGVILRSIGDGRWSTVASATSNLVWAVAGAAGQVWTVGSNGTIVQAALGGAFQVVPTPSGTRTLYGVWADATAAVAVGESGQVLRSGVGGWQAETSKTSSTLSAVWGPSAANLWAVGASGTIVRYTAGSWATEKSNTTLSLRGVWGGASAVFAVGRSGTILRSQGNGTWTSMSTPTSNDLWSVWGTSTSDVWAVGDAGTVLHYDGSKWSSVSAPSTDDLFAVAAGLAGDVFIVGDQGTILHYN